MVPIILKKTAASVNLRSHDVLTISNLEWFSANLPFSWVPICKVRILFVVLQSSDIVCNFDDSICDQSHDMQLIVLQASARNIFQQFIDSTIPSLAGQRI